MKYDISLEERLAMGYLFRAKRVPSVLSEWFSFWKFFDSKLYSALPLGYQQVYVQEENTKTGFLVQETITGAIVYGPLTDALGIIAPSPFKELYLLTQDELSLEVEKKNTKAFVNAKNNLLEKLKD